MCLFMNIYDLLHRLSYNIFNKLFHLLKFPNIYSGITSGRMLNGECYTQRLQKLTYLYMRPEDWREIFMKQSVDKYR